MLQNNKKAKKCCQILRFAIMFSQFVRAVFINSTPSTWKCP